MASKLAQKRWRERKRHNKSAPKCQCGKRLRLESRRGLCRACWLKTPEGKAYNQHIVAITASASKYKLNRPQEAKRIASRFSKELGFVNIRSLEESDTKGCLEVIQGIGFTHFHHRRDKQTTIYSLAVLSEHQRQGWGRLLFYRVLCRAIEARCDRIFLKCPSECAANAFYSSIGFKLLGTAPGKKRRLNCWQYQIQLPLLFMCNGGGTSRYDHIASECGWRLGIQSFNRSNKPGWHMEMIDNQWGDDYDHSQHLELIKANKPLIATVKDIESVEQLREALKQAREIQQYCGRVVLIPKVKSWLPSEYWLGFSIPTSHGSTSIEPTWFGDRPVHLLGGSPDAQAHYAKLMNVVSLDSKYAMHDNVAGKGKSAWQGHNCGIRVVDGCYESFKVSLEKQKQYWHCDRLQPWADGLLFSSEQSFNFSSQESLRSL
ncbi:MAG: GNAT family N-acetyltransferase [Symploca sp. SIO2E6]|nr:GNAT family N-acetyltransferase [Symploca sp. SIO2E6]